MKATKHGAKYQITYRCPNYPKIINETFDSEEEANLRIAQINLEKRGVHFCRLLTWSIRRATATCTAKPSRLRS